MDFLDILFHAINFTIPAAFMATVMTSLAPWVLRRRDSGVLWRWQWLLQFVLGCAVLLLGLWVFGRDGKVLAYGGLALAATVAQWGFSGAWRK